MQGQRCDRRRRRAEEHERRQGQAGAFCGECWNTMWKQHGHERFWVKRHRRWGPVVYDPSVDQDRNRPSVRIFMTRTEELTDRNRAEMQTRAAWTRMDDPEAQRVLEIYLHSRRWGHARQGGHDIRGQKVAQTWTLPDGMEGVRIPKHMPTSELAEGGKLLCSDHISRARLITLGTRIERCEYGEIWSTRRSEPQATGYRGSRPFTRVKKLAPKVPYGGPIHDPNGRWRGFNEVTARGRGRRPRRG